MFFTGNIANANFRGANFLSHKNSAKQNFAKITAKFRLTQRKFARALTKFRGEISSNFRENKERKIPTFVCISFAQYCKI